MNNEEILQLVTDGELDRSEIEDFKELSEKAVVKDHLTTASDNKEYNVTFGRK